MIASRATPTTGETALRSSLSAGGHIERNTEPWLRYLHRVSSGEFGGLEGRTTSDRGGRSDQGPTSSSSAVAAFRPLAIAPCIADHSV